MREIENLQKRLTGWTTPSLEDHTERLKYLEFLPVPSYMQMLDVLTYVKIASGVYDFDLGTIISYRMSEGRNNRILPIIPTVNLELSYYEFFTRTARLINFLPSTIDVFNPVGLKPWFLRFLWQQFEKNYNIMDTCNWRFACRCSSCRS